MDPLNKEEIETEIKSTIKGLSDKEENNATSFENWPKIQWTSYELEPKRRNSGLDETSKSKV